jgi:hypothetical protein
MANLQITTSTNNDTVDGMSYHFSRSNIEYSIFLLEDCIQVFKTNKQRRSSSCDCFWNGINNQGKEMAKFLKEAVDFIKA